MLQNLPLRVKTCRSGGCECTAVEQPIAAELGLRLDRGMCARIGLSLGRAAGQVRHSRKEWVPVAMLSGKSVAQRIFVRAWGDSPFAP